LQGLISLLDSLDVTDGTIIPGCNVELRSLSPSCCAERLALLRAVSEGHTSFRRIVITSDKDTFLFPCGSCRHALLQFSDMEVLTAPASGKEIKMVMLSALLPHFAESEKQNNYKQQRLHKVSLSSPVLIPPLDLSPLLNQQQSNLSPASAVKAKL